MYPVVLFLQSEVISKRASLWRFMEKVPLRLEVCSASFVILITCLGAGFRIYNLGAKSLWYDEALDWLVAQGKTLGDVVFTNARAVQAPPLFPVMLHFTSVFGQSEIAVRAIPVIAGIASIPCIYLLSLSMNPSRVAACLSALLLALAPSQVMYSQIVREYSLTVLLTILTILLLVRYITMPSTRRLILLVGLQIADLLTQYGLALLVAACSCATVCYVFRKRERPSTKRVLLWLTGQLVLGGISLFLIFSSLRWQIEAVAEMSKTSLRQAFWEFGSLSSLVHLLFVNSWRLVEFATSYDSRLLTGLFLLLGGLVAVRSNRRQLILLLLTLPFVVTIASALLRLYPYTPGRYEIFLTVPIYLLVGWGGGYLLTVNRDRLAVMFLIGIVAVNNFIGPSISTTWRYLQSPGWEQSGPLVLTLRSEIRDDDIVFVNFGAVPAFLYYWCPSVGCDSSLLADGHRRILGGDYVDERNTKVVLGASGLRDGKVDPRFSAEQVASVLSRRERTWLLFSHTGESEEEEIISLARGFGKVVERQRENGASLYVLYPN